VENTCVPVRPDLLFKGFQEKEIWKGLRLVEVKDRLLNLLGVEREAIFPKQISYWKIARINFFSFKKTINLKAFGALELDIVAEGNLGTNIYMHMYIHAYTHGDTHNGTHTHTTTHL